MATITWTGQAQDISQVVTLTFTGVWAAGDTATVTVNNKDIVVTGGSSMDTASEFAAGMKEALGLATASETAISADMTINEGGRRYGEFWDFDATVSGAVVTLTSAVPGLPFTVTKSVVTAGTGDITQATATACTGKHFFDNADNWSGGSLPLTGDVLYFESGNVSVLYGLANATLDYDLRISADYTGDIGLPVINPGLGGGSYPEYRDRYLTIPVTASATATHHIGTDGTRKASGRRYLDFGTNLALKIELYVIDSGPVSSDGPAVQIVGGYRIEAVCHGGTIAIGNAEAETQSTLQRVTLLAGKGTTAALRLGSNTAFYSTCTLEVAAGDLAIASQYVGGTHSVLLHGGTMTVEQTSAMPTITIYGGRMDFRGTAIFTLLVYRGVFDASRCESVTITNNVELYSGFTFLDPYGAAVKTLDFNGCSPGDGTLVLRGDISLVPTLI